MNETKGRSVFDISVKNLKRSKLLVPYEFIEVLNASGKQLAVMLEDDSGRTYAAILDGKENALGGGNFGAWYRSHNPGTTEYVRLEILSSGQNRLRITLAPRGERILPDGLHLGWKWNMVAAQKSELGDPYHMPIADLLTHAFICGVTGSGKTILAKALLEEALLSGIPCVVIDLKGDLSSMAIVLDREDPKILEQLQQGDTEDERHKRALAEISSHFEKLRDQNLDMSKAKRLKERVQPRIFTPRLARGIQLAFPAALATPPDARKLAHENEAQFKEFVRATVDAFVDRLYPNTKRGKIQNERNFVFEIVASSWINDVDLCGIDGLKRLLHLIDEPPFQTIGGLPVSQYIDAENRRGRLLNKVNSMISGPETLWFEGEPLTSELLLKSAKGKVPLSIINLTESDQFEDRSFVVAQVAHTLCNWMRTQSGASEPRVLLFIDEIGGGGGKQALFPSYPYECAAKWGLNYLLRQGRAFGVCSVFATQNPGDVDYKGLSNCGTWVVGHLATRRDRSKMIEGIAVTGREQKWLEDFLVRADPGDFVVRNPSGNVDYIHGRWIFSYHKVLGPQELTRL